MSKGRHIVAKFSENPWKTESAEKSRDEPEKGAAWLRSELIVYSQTEWYVVIDISFAKPGYGKLIKQHLLIKD